jgi:hypothetical protein
MLREMLQFEDTEYVKHFLLVEQQKELGDSVEGRMKYVREMFSTTRETSRAMRRVQSERAAQAIDVIVHCLESNSYIPTQMKRKYNAQPSAIWFPQQARSCCLVQNSQLHLSRHRVQYIPKTSASRDGTTRSSSGHRRQYLTYWDRIRLGRVRRVSKMKTEICDLHTCGNSTNRNWTVMRSKPTELSCKSGG